jgi:hypothetical protein
MAKKESYAGTFNISNEKIEKKADHYSAGQAKYLMIQEIALERGVIPQTVWGYLKKHPLSCEIRRCKN